MSLMPMVIEASSRGERAYDLPSRLMKDRIIILYEDVNPHTANIIIMQMLFLEGQDSDKPIHFYINSPGGSVTAGLAIYDTMKFVKAPIHTYCLGQAASMGAVLLCSGKKGQRYALPHSRIMIHQPSGGAEGQSTDIQIQAKEILRCRETLERIMAEHTGQKYEVISKDCERDNFMSPEEAKKYGLIDNIVSSKFDVKS